MQQAQSQHSQGSGPHLIWCSMKEVPQSESWMQGVPPGVSLTTSSPARHQSMNLQRSRPAPTHTER
jgi:hypothetical protein